MQVAHPAVFRSPAHDWFLSHLPEITSRARACFSRLRAEEREEAVAEVIATAFKASVSAAARGRLARVTPYRAVVYAVRQYRDGRRLGGYSSTDCTSAATQLRGRAKVISLSSVAHDPDRSSRHRPLTLAESLSDRRRDNNPYEQARQNIDYPSILRRERVSRKVKKTFKLLAAIRGSGQGKYIASILHVSPTRVWQLKQELADALARHNYSTAAAC